MPERSVAATERKGCRRETNPIFRGAQLGRPRPDVRSQNVFLRSGGVGHPIGNLELETQAAEALLETTQYMQRIGCWIDAAALGSEALLARHSLLADPFDYEKYPELVSQGADEAGKALQWSKEEFQGPAAEQFSGPLLGDVGPARIIDFRALGVRWTFIFNNDRTTVLTAEGLCAALQVFLAEIASFEPVFANVSVRV